jgi:hypothetical protein
MRVSAINLDPRIGNGDVVQFTAVLRWRKKKLG